MITPTYTPSADRIVHYTYADFTGRLVPRPVHLVQYDIALPIIALTMYKDGVTYAAPANTQASIRWLKPDNKIVYNQALGYSPDRTVVYFEITKQMTAAEGTTEPVIEILLDDDTMACSGSFPVIIDKNPVTDKDFESTSEVTSMLEYVARAETAATNASSSEAASSVHETNANVYAQQAATSAQLASNEKDAAALSASAASASETESTRQAGIAAGHANDASNAATLAGRETDKAEAWARGTIDGLPVPSTHDAYKNNSKWYAEKSESFVDEAEAWAKGTKDGIAVPSTADQYENNAKYYADEAAKSAAAASAVTGVHIATYTSPGIVMPDPNTLEIDPVTGEMKVIGGGGGGPADLPADTINNTEFANEMVLLKESIEKGQAEGGGGSGVPAGSITSEHFKEKMDELADTIKKDGSIKIDSALSDVSINAVQNKVVKAKFDEVIELASKLNAIRIDGANTIDDALNRALIYDNFKEDRALNNILFFSSEGWYLCTAVRHGGDWIYGYGFALPGFPATYDRITFQRYVSIGADTVINKIGGEEWQLIKHEILTTNEKTYAIDDITKYKSILFIVCNSSTVRLSTEVPKDMLLRIGGAQLNYFVDSRVWTNFRAFNSTSFIVNTNNTTEAYEFYIFGK